MPGHKAMKLSRWLFTALFLTGVGCSGLNGSGSTPSSTDATNLPPSMSPDPTEMVASPSPTALQTILSQSPSPSLDPAVQALLNEPNLHLELGPIPSDHNGTVTEQEAMNTTLSD